jgi:putative DNA primase/helicase
VKIDSPGETTAPMTTVGPFPMKEGATPIAPSPRVNGTPSPPTLPIEQVAPGPDMNRASVQGANDLALSSNLKPLEAEDDPHRLARLFLDQCCRHPDGMTLRSWRSEWHRWEKNAYRIVPENEIRAELTSSTKQEMDRLNLIALQRHVGDGAKPKAHKVTGRLIADVAHALASMTVLPARVHAPTWLEGEGPFPPFEMLACRNGLVHLPSLVAGKPHFFSPTPRYFSSHALDFDFDLNAPKPSIWLDFLTMLWPDDPQSIRTLQEWCGYYLTTDTRQQKILLLVGPRRSGKGTIARVIRGLVGPENVAGPTLSSLGTNFGLWPLLGKSVAMIQDARLGGRSDMAAITERLLSISGEDALTIDRKNLSPVTAKLLARFLILTNELPKLGDASGALASRMILLQLTQTWLGRENNELTDRLLAELPGILLWAIDGWQRLRQRSHFVQPDTGKGMLTDLENLSSPVGAFVRARCKVGPGCTVEKQVLFKAWQSWCEEQGRDRPGDSATFGRNLRAVVPNLGEGYPRRDESRVYVYEGIALA